MNVPVLRGSFVEPHLLCALSVSLGGSHVYWRSVALMSVL